MQPFLLIVNPWYDTEFPDFELLLGLLFIGLRSSASLFEGNWTLLVAIIVAWVSKLAALASGERDTGLSGTML